MEKQTNRARAPFTLQPSLFALLSLFILHSSLFSCASTPQQAVNQRAEQEQYPSEVSTITIPIRTTLAPLLPQVESQVPKTMEKLDAYELDPTKGYGLKYRVTRDPIVLNMAGTGLHATLTVRYQLEGCRRTTKPFSKETTMWPCISCGFGEPMREAFIAIDSHLEWDASWRLRSKTTARPVEFPNRCTVTFVGIDISDWRLGPLVNEQLRDLAKTIDANTPKVTNLKPNVEQIWSALQSPLEVAPKTWLVLEPIDLAVAPITGSGLSVQSALTLHARTRLVIGARPAVATSRLPPLRVETSNGGGIRIPFSIELPYAEASRIITEQFGKKKYKAGGGELALEHLTLAPAPDGRLTIEAEIDFHGGLLKKYHGLVYLEGSPQFDAATRRMKIVDIDYSIDPRRHNPFVRTADRLAHDSVRKAIAENASWSMAGELERMRGDIEKAISRPLGKGITLRGKVESIEPGKMDIASDRITIHALATGSADIEAREW